MEPRELVLQYLDEAHATETALVTTLRAHSAMAPDGPYRKLLERHMQETVDQVEAIERRRSQLAEDDGGRGVVGTGAGLVRDVIGQALVLTKGPLDAVRARGSAERMLKNAKDECATEALEIATYDALEAAALAAGDEQTARLARDHRATEERMLADLRKQIPKLAVAAVDQRTDGADTSATTKSGSGASTRGSSSQGSSTTSRSGRSTPRAKSGSSSGSSRSSSSSRGSGSSRASGSAKSSGSSSKSSGSSSRSGGSSTKSSGSSTKSGGSSSRSSGAAKKSSGSSTKSSGASSRSSSGSSTKSSGSATKSRGSSSKSSGSSSSGSNGSSGSRTPAASGSRS